MGRQLVFPSIPQIHADAGEDLTEVTRASRIQSGLMKDFQFDPSSLVHQKRDLLCLRAARQRALYTEIKNFSSAVTATTQDELRALCSDDTSDKLQCSLKIQTPDVLRN